MREADLDSVRGKAVDVEEETGRCTPRDRRDRGPGTQGRIRRDNVGKVPPAAGAGRNCRDSSNEAKAEGEESEWDRRMSLQELGPGSNVLAGDGSRLPDQLQEMFEAPDIRPLSASDISAANRRHDETLAHCPWFRLWQRYGVCCRPESPGLRLDEIEG
jgi:hypothetical protein